MSKQPISSKNTKNQILEAYEELLQNSRKRKPKNPGKFRNSRNRRRLSKMLPVLAQKALLRMYQG